MTQINQWVSKTLTSFKNVKKIKLSLSIFLNLVGFFAGNICATLLGIIFNWNGFAAFIVLLSIEITGLVEYNPVNRNNQALHYFGIFKRGFFFGLLADGFKVGS